MRDAIPVGEVQPQEFILYGPRRAGRMKKKVAKALADPETREKVKEVIEEHPVAAKKVKEFVEEHPKISKWAKEAASREHKSVRGLDMYGHVRTVYPEGYPYEIYETHHHLRPAEWSDDARDRREER